MNASPNIASGVSCLKIEKPNTVEIANSTTSPATIATRRATRDRRVGGVVGGSGGCGALRRGRGIDSSGMRGNPRYDASGKIESGGSG